MRATWLLLLLVVLVLVLVLVTSIGFIRHWLAVCTGDH